MFYFIVHRSYFIVSAHAPNPASRSGCGRAMTCELISSPTLPAASAPASTAAFTEPTSPRTIVVTNAPPIWIVFTISTFAALVIASVASTSGVQPFVSIIPIASAIGVSVVFPRGWPLKWLAQMSLFHLRWRLRAGRLLLGHHPAQLIVGARD